MYIWLMTVLSLGSSFGGCDLQSAFQSWTPLASASFLACSKSVYQAGFLVELACNFFAYMNAAECEAALIQGAQDIDEHKFSFVVES